MRPTLDFVPSSLVPSPGFFGPLMAALGECGVDSVATSLEDEGVDG
jgi:hypothetical protein